MPVPLRILIVEDSREDAQLLLLHLEADGLAFTSQLVDSLEGFLAALPQGPWDLVLSDYSLPGTDGMEVLRCLRERDPDLPFILLSGVLHEGAAVAAMRAGANDFLLKGNLSRLVPAIEREMKEAEFRRKQRAFEEELRLLHSAIGQTPDMVIITDPEGITLYANAAAEAISGFRRDELLGQNPRLFKSDRHDAAFYRAMWEVLLRGETWKGRIVNQRKDGSLWEAESVISPVYSTTGDLQNYLCTARDITLERQLQGLLEQSQRLETIGTLTSGIAHDFNNILMPVLGHAELGLAREPGDPGVKHDLEVILASGNRARDLVRQILTFSRKEEGCQTPIAFQSLLSESLKLLRATVPTSIAFEVDLAAPEALVLGDPTQMHQVILNLCTNASYAMRGLAGRLRIGLHRLQLDRTPCAMNILLEPGEYLCLEVADTGRGIRAEDLPRIFLPFFSTKPKTEGTGLGLSVIHGIVSDLAGGFQVTSKVQVGTTFRVFLPVAGAGAGQAPSQDRPDTEVIHGRGHVLLVDDEEILLDMLHTSLAGMGFRVSAFQDPQAALRAFLREPADVQVLVTDHTMPGLTGVELAEAMWALNPALPAILLSGDSDLGRTSPVFRLARFRACLTKPMFPRDLGRAILKVLPGTGADPHG